MSDRVTSAAAAEALLSADPVEEARMRRRLRRNGVVLIVTLDVLIVAVGISGTSDLRRLATPSGAAAAWVDAAGSGDCDRYTDLETAARLAGELTGAQTGTTAASAQRTALCDRVATGWSGYGTTQSRVVTATSTRAVVDVSAAKAGAAAVTGELLMRKVGGRWKVDAPGGACVTPAYAPATALCSGVSITAN